MPRVPIDYSKTIIYRIVCKDPTIKDTYVGSTIDFKSRKSHHKSSCNNINDKDYYYMVYQLIRDNGGWNNWDMVEIEKYNAIDKLDADKRERYWLEFYQATLNKCIPSRTTYEWYESNKNKKSQYAKNRYGEHKEEICEKHRNDYYNNKDAVLAQQQKYRDENRDEINRRARERRHQNKEQKLMSKNDICVM